MKKDAYVDRVTRQSSNGNLHERFGYEARL